MCTKYDEIKYIIKYQNNLMEWMWINLKLKNYKIIRTIFQTNLQKVKYFDWIHKISHIRKLRT